jgi:hypothetical protein
MQITLYDQFDQFFPHNTTNFLVMDKFANPVMKNDEPFFDPLIHQAWSQNKDPQDIKEVGLLNQFGHKHTWPSTGSNRRY